MSPMLFNFVLEKVIRLEEGVKLQNSSVLAYADDLVLMEKSTECTEITVRTITKNAGSKGKITDK